MFCVGQENKPLFVLQIFSPPCGIEMDLSLESPKFTSHVASDYQLTTPKPLNKYLNHKDQTSKLLLRISVTTTIPTTSECTLNTQIAPKPCNLNQII